MAAWLERARIRAALAGEDLARVEAFLGSSRVRAVAEGHPEEPGAVRFCERDGEILAAILLDPTPLRLRDVPVPCIRLAETGGEDGRAHFRETGDRDLFAMMLEDALGYGFARGYAVAFVHGELGLYPDHGFVPCFYHPRVFVDVAAAMAVPAPYRVRHMKADDVAQIQALRAAGRRWKPVVHASGVRLFRHFSVEAPDRSVRGFVSLDADADADWNPKVHAPEVEAQDRAAACTILRHCAEKAREIGVQELHFPLGPGHPVARLCLELGGRAVLRAASTDPFLDEEMVRVLDPCALVRAFAPAMEGPEAPPVHFVTDEGCWRLAAGPSGARLDVLDLAPERAVRLPHWMFTQLLAGYRGPDELDTTVSPAEADALARLFPKTWPLSVCDPDLWEDLLPPLPLADDAAAHLRSTRLPWADFGG